MKYGGITIILCAVILALYGCDTAKKLDTTFVQTVDYASSDQRLPAEFRDIIALQANSYMKLTVSKTKLAPSSNDIAVYAENMRQSNWKLTSILADQVIQTSADGPPIKRINAWTAISAILDYAALEKIAQFRSADIRTQVAGYYEKALQSGNIDQLGQLLHFDMDSLYALLQNSLETEKSQNVKTAAQPVLDKLSAAIAKYSE